PPTASFESTKGKTSPVPRLLTEARPASLAARYGSPPLQQVAPSGKLGAAQPDMAGFPASVPDSRNPLMSTRSWTATPAVAAGLRPAARRPGGGGGPPPADTTTAEANVHGTITFKGKPVTKGEVAFDPSNYLRKNEASRRVEIGKDGSYSVKTLAGVNR